MQGIQMADLKFDLFLSLEALGNTQVRSRDTDSLTRLVTYDGGAAEDHMDAAIGAHNTILNVARTSFEKLGVAAHHKVAVVGMHNLRVILEGPALAVVVAEKEAQVFACVEYFSCYQIMFPTTGIGQRFCLPHNLLALSKRFFGVLALRDVMANPNQCIARPRSVHPRNPMRIPPLILYRALIRFTLNGDFCASNIFFFTLRLSRFGSAHLPPFLAQ